MGVKDEKKQIMTLALDRIHQIEKLTTTYIINDTIDLSSYYEHIIGVTDSNVRPQNVELSVDRSSAPYVITKPLHHSQKVISKGQEGIVIQIKVKMNFELEREILGFGESMKVIKPKWLVNKIADRLQKSTKLYD